MKVAESASIVTLSDRSPFARGGKRICYIDPHHPDRCLKLILEEQRPEDMLQRAPWHRRWRKTAADFDENLREWKTHQWLESHRDEAVWQIVPRCYGWVETDLGRALSFAICRDADGLISRSLLDYIGTTGYTPELQAGVERFGATWIEQSVPAHNFMLNNLVCQRLADGSFHLWMIDGLGPKTFLPLVNWSRTIARRDAKQRVAFLQQRIARTLKRIKEGRRPNRGKGILLKRQ